MKFDVLTLFPEMFIPIKESIIGRATKSKILEINLVNIRDFSAWTCRRYTVWWRSWNVDKTRCGL